MALADFLAIAYEKRAIPGEYGLRQYSVALVVERWTGQHTGEGERFEEYTAITEALSQPPKVRWVTDEEVALGALSGSIEVGPITPQFTSGLVTGGTDLTAFIEALDQNAARYIQITGPKHPNGARYRITNIEARPTRYVIRAAPTGDTVA